MTVIPGILWCRRLGEKLGNSAAETGIPGIPGILRILLVEILGTTR